MYLSLSIVASLKNSFFAINLFRFDNLSADMAEDCTFE